MCSKIYWRPRGDLYCRTCSSTPLLSCAGNKWLIGAVYWILSSEVFPKEVPSTYPATLLSGIIMSEKQCSKFMVSYTQYTCSQFLHSVALVVDTQVFHFLRMIAILACYKAIQSRYMYISKALQRIFNTELSTCT